MEVFPVDNTDYLFKIALQNNKLHEVKEILQRGTLCGRSIVCYLKEQGFSEIALHFEKDPRQRFNLALSSGNLQIAFESARELKEKDLFVKLSAAAISLGNYEIPEKCFQLNREFDKLNFFYAVTGSVGKLFKMQNVAESTKDPMLRFNTSILTGNVEDRVRTLVEAGQLPLAYLAAKAHGLDEMVEFLGQEMQDSTEYDHLDVIDQTNEFITKGKTLLPLKPINLKEASIGQWPMVNLRAKEAERAA